MKNRFVTFLWTALLTAAAIHSAQAIPLLDSADKVLGGRAAAGVFTVAAPGTAADVNNFPAAEGPAFAIDQNSGTKYLNFAKTDTGLLLTPTEGQTLLTSFTLTTANDGPERDPASYILFGSNTVQITGLEPAGTTFNLSSFTQIATGSVLGIDPGRQTSSGPIAVNAATPWTSYLITFPTVRNAAGANSMQIADLQFEARVVPEPSTGLFALALAGVVAVRRRHTR